MLYILFLRKRLPDSLLKIDALSGLVRGDGARPPGALLLHHSAWSAQGQCRLQLFQDGLTTKVYPKLYLQLELFFQDPELKCHRHLFLVFKWRIMVSGAVG